MQRRASEPLPGLVLGTGFEDFIDSTYGFNILGPDPDDPTASVMQPALQRRCSPNGTAPFAINPVKPQSGICLEGTLYQESSSGVVHYTTDLTEHAAVDPKLNLTQYGVERVSVLASRNWPALIAFIPIALSIQAQDNKLNTVELWTFQTGVSLYGLRDHCVWGRWKPHVAEQRSGAIAKVQMRGAEEDAEG
jgi:hypothetical protein